MKKGVLLIATGHRNYYRMAEVMAASIRVNNPDLKICLACDGKYNTNAFLFDSVKAIPVKYLSESIKPKLYMDKLSPFDETLFLDVDQVMIMKRDLNTIFSECENIDVTFSNTGISGGSVWADINEINKKYGSGKMWNLHSEIVYFKKNEGSKKYFNAARAEYNSPTIKSAKTFAGGHMADELAFQIASMETGIFPHKENWCPNFWFDAHPKQSRAYTYQLTDYITYSIGGKMVPEWVKTQYNTLAKAYFAKLGLSNPYQVVDKRNFLPERRTI